MFGLAPFLRPEPTGIANLAAGCHTRRSQRTCQGAIDSASLCTRSFRRPGCQPQLVGILTSDHSFGMTLSSLLSPLSTGHVTTDRDSAAGFLRRKPIMNNRIRLGCFSLRQLELVRVFRTRFLGASPRFQRGEGGKALRLRSCSRFRQSAGVSALDPSLPRSSTI